VAEATPNLPVLQLLTWPSACYHSFRLSEGFRGNACISMCCFAGGFDRESHTEVTMWNNSKIV